MGQPVYVVTHSLRGAHSRIDFLSVDAAMAYARDRETSGDLDRLEVVEGHKIVYVGEGVKAETSTV